MRGFYIAVPIMLLLTVQAKSQTRLATLPDPDTKIVRFYPNPAISQINFDFQKKFDRNYSLQIYNFLGKKVYEKVFETNDADQKTIVNLSDFFRGIYIFQLMDQNGKIVQSGKFQVMK